MANFETICLFPVYCRACRTLRTANLLESPVTCPGCGGEDVTSYDAPELFGEPGGDWVFSWHRRERFGRALCLSDGRYLCPACGQMRLRFERSGSWD
jgi:hypothetical protein